MICIPLNQFSYIIPLIRKLSKYFDLKFYYIVDWLSDYSIINLKELYNFNLIDKNIEFINMLQFIEIIKTDTSNNLYLITSEQLVFGNADHSTIPRTNILYYGHGIDEEEYVLLLRNSCSWKDFYLSKILSHDDDLERLIKIYKLDNSKRTITIFDSINSSFLKNCDPINKEITDYQNRLIDQLISLKNKYNIIIRFHPQDYIGNIKGILSIPNIIKANFIIDFTPICVYSFYKISDIIISSRYSSSGYQAIFHPYKPLILIDLDIDARKNSLDGNKHPIVLTKDNDFINNEINNGNLISQKEVYITNEQHLNILPIIEEIENSDYRISEEMYQHRLTFIKKKYKILEKDILEVPSDDYFMKCILNRG